MTDLDDRLRRDLLALADRMPTSDIADGAVRYGQQIRRGRRATVAVIAVVAAVAAVVIPLSLNTGSSGSPTAKLAQKPPTALPLPEGTTRADRPFDVAGPPSAVFTGLPQREHRACTPAETRATATLRPSPDGVVGVVDLTSSHHCAVQLDTIQMTLLDPAGQPLGVQVAGPSRFIPATNEDSAPFSSFGFAWDGSWCSARAAALSVALKNGSVRATLSGPQPACTGSTNSVIIPGAVGYIGDPVQGAPPEWRSLTTTLSVAPVTSGPALDDLQVTLTNSSGAAVTLQPTPTYLIAIEPRNGAGGLDYQIEHLLPLKPGAFVVPAHGTLRIALPDEPIPADIYKHLRGRQAIVSYVMAGFADAQANTRVTN
jgi:hypothetical protein